MIHERNATTPRLFRAAAIAAILCSGGCELLEEEDNDEGGQVTGVTAGTGDGTGRNGSNTPAACRESVPNNTRDTATPVVPGVPFVACISGASDHDWYELTAPPEDGSGGYYTFAFTDLVDGMLALDAYVASDNTQVLGYVHAGTNGASLFAYLAAAPGQKYRIDVSSFAGVGAAYTYKLSIVYHKVEDAFEPNDSRETAKPLPVGAPQQAFVFAGPTSGGGVSRAGTSDWFALDLQPGPATIRITDFPTNVAPELGLLTPEGNSFFANDVYNTNAGGPLNVPIMVKTAGTHKLWLNVFVTPPAQGGATNPELAVPNSYVHPYTITVTQP